MLEDILASFGGSGSVAAIVEQELQKLRERSGLKPEEVDAIARSVRDRLAQRAQQAQAFAVPALDVVGGLVRRALDVPSKSELETLLARIREATEALEKANAGRAAPAAPAAKPAPEGPGRTG